MQSFCCHSRLLRLLLANESPTLNHSISCIVMNSFPMSGGETWPLRRAACANAFHQLTLGLVDMCNDAFGNLASAVCSMIAYSFDSSSKSAGSGEALNTVHFRRVGSASQDQNGSESTLVGSNLQDPNLYRLDRRRGLGALRQPSQLPKHPNNLNHTSQRPPAIPINCPTASQQQPEPHSGTNRSSARK